MKFLCVECDHVMEFTERQLPGDGTLAAVFRCGSCQREMGLLTNPMETQLVSSLGVKIGGREVPEQPMELTRSSLEGRDGAFAEEADGAGAEKGAGPSRASGAAGEAAGADTGHGAQPHAGPVGWSDEAIDRLGRVPSFVRGMVKRIYADWARERGIETITPEIMDRARTELGLEGM